MAAGILYIVSTPIGNPGDITKRALQVLSTVNLVVCEERRVGSTLLAHYGIERPIVELNEHSAADELPALVERLSRGENLALMSDHGTPLVADPGQGLVQQAIDTGIRVTPIPGASAVIAGLVASGLPASRFRFLGQLPAKTEARQRALRALRDVPDTLVLLDTPYRLLPLLRACRMELGKERQIAVACNLTMPDELIVRGSLAAVTERFTREPFKGEFVLVIEPARVGVRQQRR